VRLFVALATPHEVRAAVSEAQRLLMPRLATGDVRWQDLSRSHLTLRFLGEVEEADLAACRFAVTESAYRSPSFELQTARYGAFPAPERPSVLWLGVAGDVASLERLQAGVATRLEPVASAAATETFRPHLTLGRVRSLPVELRREMPAILAELPPAPVRWLVTSLQLVRSRLSSTGPAHEVLLDSPLGAAGSPPLSS
jgi:2'-5' RNA ligase